MSFLPDSPDIQPEEVAAKTPAEIHSIAIRKGLLPKGPDPAQGQGAYLDPVTSRQRILIHPEDGHAHVNNPNGDRLGLDGEVVPKNSTKAHLPLRSEN